MARTVHDNGGAPAGTVLPLEYFVQRTMKNLKSHDPSPEDRCRPQNMEGLEYLLLEPAFEVNEKGTRENNDGSADVNMDDNEKIDADLDAESFAEEEWNDPE